MTSLQFCQRERRTNYPAKSWRRLRRSHLPDARCRDGPAFCGWNVSQDPFIRALEAEFSVHCRKLVPGWNQFSAHELQLFGQSSEISSYFAINGNKDWTELRAQVGRILKLRPDQIGKMTWVTFRACVERAGNILDKQRESADAAADSALIALTPNELAIFDELSDEPKTGADIVSALVRQGITSIDTSALSRACNRPAMKARGVRNRKGAGYYKIAPAPK